MTKTLISSGDLSKNQATIFYNLVGNFIPPEWRNLTNNCGKKLSKSSCQLLLLIVFHLQSYNPQEKQPVKELQESYYFFQQKLGVCQSRVKQCLVELKKSGFIEYSIDTIIKYHIKCRNTICIKLTKTCRRKRNPKIQRMAWNSH